MKGKCEACQEEFEEYQLVDAIYDNKIAKLCKRCIKTTDAAVINEPSEIEIEDVTRRSVREILSSMAGIDMKDLKPIKKPAKNIVLEDLRERYNELKEIKKKREEEKQEQEKSKEQQPGQEIKETKENNENVLGAASTTQELEKEINAIKEAKSREDVLDFSLGATKEIKVKDLLQIKKTEENADVKTAEEPEEIREIKNPDEVEKMVDVEAIGEQKTEEI